MKTARSLASNALSTVLALSLGLPLLGCTRDQPPEALEAKEPTLEERLDALAACTPTDVVMLVTWTGPAFDPATGALLEPLPAGHVEAVVNGWRNRSEEAAKLNMEHAQRAVEDLFTREGLLGFESAESEECDFSFSHTLWRDEASMLAFITGAAHASAMAESSKMHHATAGAHWTGEARDTAPTWKEGLDRMIEEVRAELE